jgi:hypothetical protein
MSKQLQTISNPNECKDEKPVQCCRGLTIKIITKISYLPTPGRHIGLTVCSKLAIWNGKQKHN